MSTYDDLIVLDRAVAHWPLDETTGTTAADISGHGHDATLYHSPAMGVPGPVAGQAAMDFSSTGVHNPYGVIALPAALPTVPDSCTWECWVKIPASATDNSAPFSVANNSSSYTGYYLALQPGTPASIFVGRYGGRPASDDAGADTPTIMDGNWHQVVFTNAGGGGASALYLDGVPLALTISDAFVTALTADAALLAGDAEGYDPAYSYEGRFTGALAHVALYDYALTACQVKSHYDLATTGTYTPCADWLRLRHASGRSYIQQNGAQVQVVAGGAGVLDLPLPALAVAPARYVGVDAATGLPASAPLPPLPPAALSTYVTPVAPAPVPAGPTADTVRCGAAHQMATRLTRLYNIVRAAVGAALDVGGPLVASAIVDIALDILTEGTMGTWVAANGESYRFMKIVLGGAINAIEQGLLPPLDATATHGLVNAAYEALPAGQTPIAITQAALDQWATNISNNSAAFLGAADTTLRLLVPTIPLDQWQQEINTGSQYPSSDCA